MNTTAYLINKCPYSTVKFKTSMEIWSGNPADYMDLKVFGCIAYAHIRRDKLETRAVKCVFI